MNFQELLSKMVELDQPVPEATIQQAAPVLDEPATDITPVVEEPNEGNEFTGALEKAKTAGQEEFEVDGKKYKGRSIRMNDADSGAPPKTKSKSYQ
jgi:hypothetical protein